jgi:hypothetical protein
MNALQLKALLLDTIMHIKHGSHLHPNYKVAKQTLCEIMGVSFKTTSKTLLIYIGGVYAENNLHDEFQQTLAKFDM